MATAGTLRTWTRPEAAPELRPPCGCTCDLCREPDDASAPQPIQAITARPSPVRPVGAKLVRQVERGHVVTIADCDAVFGAELRVY